MKNKINNSTRFTALLLIFCLFFCCIGCSCGGAKEPPQSYTVTFMADGEAISTQTVNEGETVTLPAAPSKKNHRFEGWYTDSHFKYPFEPTTSIKSHTWLYAKFTMDAAQVTNEITMNTIRATVKVKVTYYNKFLGFRVDEYPFFGSGVILKKMPSGNYLLITNCHVVYKRPDRDYVEYTVIDYLGNSYSASLMHTYDNSGYAIDPKYDLACLCFDPGENTLMTLPFAEEDAEIGSDLISIGYPNGQSNAITFGKLIEYRSLTLDNAPPEASDVTFPVVRHTALINGGSSGGALLNPDLELIGLNYAAQKSDDDFNLGGAIPISKVREFLAACFPM